MPLLFPRAEWPRLLEEVRSTVPEAFYDDGHPLNLSEGSWHRPGHRRPFLSPVDGSLLGAYPMLELDEALAAVDYAAKEAGPWGALPLEQRRDKVADCIQQLRLLTDLLTYLLVWEIGKPVSQARMDVVRCLDGVEWYLGEIGSMVEGRAPIGLVSNIASWNYPMSVLMHAALVQCLAGNAVISKTPSDGGLFTLTVAHAVARRCGLPVSLVSGSGGKLSDALVRNEAVECLAFVGGKSNGRDIAASLYDRDKRYMLEMEGVNALGVWNYSDWNRLAQQIRSGFAYGKQRCTAYIRFVVQRSLFPQFLECYLGAVRSVKIGHPLLVEGRDDPPPGLDFGPLINSKKVEELNVLVSEALGLGAVPLLRGVMDESQFLPRQDTSAYFEPVALLDVPRNCRLYHNEAFGPVDTIVVVDKLEELITEMNVSNGSLVSSIASDDEAIARAVGAETQSFKFGVNKLRSRGDRDEVFGGIGQSWKGCFVGGKHLVHAVTIGPPGERLYGNFPDYILLPDAR